MGIDIVASSVCLGAHMPLYSIQNTKREKRKKERKRT
jgi:hypothetical protein